MVYLAGSVPDNLRLENYTIQPLPKGVIINGNIEDHDQLVSYLQQAYQQLGSSYKNVTAALPQALTNIQTITYDARSSDLPVDEFVELEASQTIGSDNLSYDFQVTAELQNGNVQALPLRPHLITWQRELNRPPPELPSCSPEINMIVMNLKKKAAYSSVFSGDVLRKCANFVIGLVNFLKDLSHAFFWEKIKPVSNGLLFFEHWLALNQIA